MYDAARLTTETPIYVMLQMQKKKQRERKQQLIRMRGPEFNHSPEYIITERFIVVIQAQGLGLYKVVASFTKDNPHGRHVFISQRPMNGYCLLEGKHEVDRGHISSPAKQLL